MAVLRALLQAEPPLRADLMPLAVFLAPLPRMRLMLPEPLRLLADLLASASNRRAILPVHLRVLLSPRPVAMANDPTRAHQTRAATTLSSSQPLLPARKGPAAGAPLFLLLRFVSKPAPALASVSTPLPLLVSSHVPIFRA